MNTTASAFVPLPALSTDVALQTAVHTTGILSCLSCLLVFASIYYTPKLRTTINTMICWLTLSDFFLTLALGLGTSTLASYGPTNLLPVPCLLQGMAIEFFDYAVCTWNVVIPLHCYFLMHTDNPEKLESNWKYYHGFAWGLGALFLVLLYIVQETAAGSRSGHIIGNATLVCWISDSYKEFRIWLFYLFLWLQLVAILAIYGTLFVQVKRMLAGREISQSASKNMKRMVYKAVCIAIGFSICWVPATTNRILGTIGKPVPYWMYMLQAVTMPAHGLADSIIFLIFAYAKVQESSEAADTESSTADTRSYELQKTEK